MTGDRAAAGRGKHVVRVSAALADLVPGFLANRCAEVEVIGQAIARGDFESLQRLGHRLKGDGGGYGFPAISEIGRRLEGAARSRDTGELRSLCRTLSDYLASVEVEYEP
jgi:HPt (histidine-containing phosphotransfer) domain-containing protein